MLTQRDLQSSLASLTLWTQKSAATEAPDAETSTILGSLFRDGIILFTVTSPAIKRGGLLLAVAVPED